MVIMVQTTNSTDKFFMFFTDEFNDFILMFRAHVNGIIWSFSELLCDQAIKIGNGQIFLVDWKVFVAIETKDFFLFFEGFRDAFFTLGMHVARQSQRNSGESIGLFAFWAKGWIFGWFHFF